MASKAKTIIVRMQSTGSAFFKMTRKNPKNNPGVKLRKKMYDPVVRKHVWFEEKKVSK